MSAAQTIELQKILTKHKFTEKEATQLIDYVDEKKSDEVSRGEFNLLRVFVIGGFTVSFIIMGLLYNEIKDTRQELKGDIKELRADVKGDIKELKGDIKELRADIKEIKKLILQKR